MRQRKSEIERLIKKISDEVNWEYQAAWSGRGMARPGCIPTSLVPRHSGRVLAPAPTTPESMHP